MDAQQGLLTVFTEVSDEEADVLQSEMTMDATVDGAEYSSSDPTCPLVRPPCFKTCSTKQEFAPTTPTCAPTTTAYAQTTPTKSGREDYYKLAFVTNYDVQEEGRFTLFCWY